MISESLMSRIACRLRRAAGAPGVGDVTNQRGTDFMDYASLLSGGSEVECVINVTDRPTQPELRARIRPGVRRPTDLCRAQRGEKLGSGPSDRPTHPLRVPACRTVVLTCPTTLMPRCAQRGEKLGSGPSDRPTRSMYIHWVARTDRPTHPRPPWVTLITHSISKPLS